MSWVDVGSWRNMARGQTSVEARMNVECGKVIGEQRARIDSGGIR